MQDLANTIYSLICPGPQRTKVITTRGARLTYLDGKTTDYNSGEWKHPLREVVFELAGVPVMIPDHFRVEHVEAHLAGTAHYGAVPADLTHWIVFDMDAHDAAQERSLEARTSRVIAWVRERWEVEPVVYTTPRGGIHVLVVTDLPYYRTELVKVLDAAVEEIGITGVDVFPCPGKKGAGATGNGVRLPLGISKPKKGNQLVESRLLDPDTLAPRYASRAEDIDALASALDAAVVPLTRIYPGIDLDFLGIHCRDEHGVLVSDFDAWDVQRADLERWEQVRAHRAWKKKAKHKGKGKGKAMLQAVDAGGDLIQEIPPVGKRSWTPTVIQGDGAAAAPAPARSWVERIAQDERDGAADGAAGSDSEWSTVKQICFARYIAGNENPGTVLQTVMAWANRRGCCPEQARRQAENQIEWLDGEVAKGRYRRGLKTTFELLGLSAKPCEVATRLLEEQEVIDAIADEVRTGIHAGTIKASAKPERIVEAAIDILHWVREHGTTTTNQIRAIQGIGTRRVEIDGERVHLAVAARQALETTGYLRKIRSHCANKQSAVYGLDYEMTIELRSRLGLAGIVEYCYQATGTGATVATPVLVENTRVPVVIEIEVSQDELDSKGHAAAPEVAAILLDDGALEAIANLATSDEEREQVTAVLTEIRDTGSIADVDMPVLAKESLRQILFEVRDEHHRDGRRWGLHFAGMRRIRTRLGLTAPRIVPKVRADNDEKSAR